MKYSTRYKPELICSKDGTRPSIEDAELREINGKPVLCATDGRRLVVIPVEECDPSEYGRVPKKALQFAKQSRKDKRQPIVKLDLNGSVKFENGWTMPREQGLIFPNVQSVIPGNRQEIKVCFNAKYLYEIAQAMGVENVSLGFVQQGSQVIDAIRVTAENEKAFGVLMPVRISP